MNVKPNLKLMQDFDSFLSSIEINKSNNIDFMLFMQNHFTTISLAMVS